jgi:FtsZ-binding cell division protein ZapB
MRKIEIDLNEYLDLLECKLEILEHNLLGAKISEDSDEIELIEINIIELKEKIDLLK